MSSVSQVWDPIGKVWRHKDDDQFVLYVAPDASVHVVAGGEVVTSSLEGARINELDKEVAALLRGNP